MSPAAIAERAAALGLHAAAMTDHNSALNCRAFNKCCLKHNILPVFGIEVTSLEESHILCLFKTVEQAETLGEIIYKKLANITNDPQKFGDQVYVDEDENILGEIEKYLVSACELSLDDLHGIVKELDGMFIPAHIDRISFSIPSQLGFLPPMDYSALETVQKPCPVETGSNTLIRNSDAHYLDNIGCRYTEYEVESLSFEHIRDAIIANRVKI